MKGRKREKKQRTVELFNRLSLREWWRPAGMWVTDRGGFRVEFKRPSFWRRVVEYWMTGDAWLDSPRKR